MGKSTGSTDTKYELSPEQRQIMTSAMGQYMPGGNLPTHSPTFDYNSNSGLQTTGQQYVAPFSEPSQQAFAATEANYGAQQPTMDAAKGLTVAGSGQAGQFQNAPDGWTTDANGKASYQDYNTGIQRYMSPFTNSVINTGLGFLDTARQRANMDTTNDTISKGSFGGTRQAVRYSLNDASFGAQAQNLISSNLQSGYTNAQNQYNTGFGQGQQALGYNTGVAQGDRSAALAGGAQLGDLAGKNQALVGNDINALASVGGQIEAKDQAARDAARADQMQNSTYGISIAQALAGMGAPPSSTTTQNVSGSSIWGSAAGAGLSALAAFSDERSKEGIETADPDDALAEIRKLKPKIFQYTQHAKSVGAPEGRRPGFMAQDLEKATGKPSMAMPGGYKGVDISEHIGRLTHAVQALDKQVRSIKPAKKAA